MAKLESNILGKIKRKVRSEVEKRDNIAKNIKDLRSVGEHDAARKLLELRKNDPSFQEDELRVKNARIDAINKKNILLEKKEKFENAELTEVENFLEKITNSGYISPEEMSYLFTKNIPNCDGLSENEISRMRESLVNRKLEVKDNTIVKNIMHKVFEDKEMDNLSDEEMLKIAFEYALKNTKEDGDSLISAQIPEHIIYKGKEVVLTNRLFSKIAEEAGIHFSHSTESSDYNHGVWYNSFADDYAFNYPLNISRDTNIYFFSTSVLNKEAESIWWKDLPDDVPLGYIAFLHYLKTGEYLGDGEYFCTEWHNTEFNHGTFRTFPAHRLRRFSKNLLAYFKL